ncbi:uncharacterized protein LY89DRAFT_691255 [Mollisia scopiformis]|uniref:Uncharacterized protein n=1 Tax=Mollisia scopiformis TaxID=149040 RepID=A0A132B8D7_MOLSC|nr:uncharacterized protein LY89DRAFT_691255 [Mollisia scopiformis]KUJ07937.1 hypothetical protein LY89DRAFT_691255 [Mollisia scopiformis]
MLNFRVETKNETKCYATHGVLGHVDPKQPPVKRKPFSAILNHDFIQKVELFLPEELYRIVEKGIINALPAPSYSSVILPLAALLEGEFFNEYIKRGNILMLSEGRLGVDNVYSLREGVLTLHLDKESYERAGLVGQPEGVKGKRGTKPRWAVEVNLRLPSMLHGKKGFDRIVYAFKTVLTAPVTWLFLNLETKAADPDPFDAHFPARKVATTQVTRDIQVKMPSLVPPTEVDSAYGADFEDYAVEMYEWLSLLQLDSPRILADDKTDPFLSRYNISGDTSTNCSLVKVNWRGFMSAFWVRDAFVQILQVIPREAWFVFRADEVGCGPHKQNRSCTIVKLPKAPTEYMLWEIA